MAPELDLSGFWELLETNFPLAGPRKRLGELLGAETVQSLEAAGILRYLRVAEEYPCPQPGETGCPRQVLACADGSFTAVCGNEPAECPSLSLGLADVEVLGTDPRRLCEVLRRPLGFGGQVADLEGMRHAYRAGSFVPQSGLHYPVYFVARCNAGEYETVFEALRSRREHQGFAVLVPTDRFLAESTFRQMQSVGVPVLPLAGAVALGKDGNLVACVDPERFFSGIGRRGPGPVPVTSAVVARARTETGWVDLDEAEYQKLAASAEQYDIFVDERARATGRRKGKSFKWRCDVQASYFRLLREAVESTGYYDPGADDDLEDGKQTFIRARQSVDIRGKDQQGKTAWRLFKSRMTVKHSVYQFDPDGGVRFALVFLPPSWGQPGL